MSISFKVFHFNTTIGAREGGGGGMSPWAMQCFFTLRTLRVDTSGFFYTVVLSYPVPSCPFLQATQAESCK